MGIRLFFAGDVVLSSQQQTSLMSKELMEKIQGCDIACCNFEAPISFPNQIASAKIGPSISQNVNAVKQLASDGFNLFCLANNHIMDYGEAGLKNTIDLLDGFGVTHIGAGFDGEEVYAPYILEKENIRIGILSGAENGFGSYTQNVDAGYAWYGADLFNNKLGALVAECDFVIVVCHGGAEKWNYPLPEYRSLYKSWIDRGAGAVIAHHPHVPQGWEEYNNGFIFYSLGNFAFDKGLGIQDPETISVILEIEKTGAKYEIVKSEFTSEGVVINRRQTFDEHLQECNAILHSDRYLEEVNKKSIEQFERRYRGYYLAISNIYSGSLKKVLKTLLLRYIRREHFSETWLYHNIEIETHYWICRRALMLRRGKVNIR